jgi:putative transcriptional regulator
MSHLVHDLAELALGTMDGAGRAEAQRHLDTCPRCRAELDRDRELLATLGLSLAPAPPAPSTRERLLRDAAVSGPGAFADLMARTFDVGLDDATAIIQSAVRGRSWAPGPLRGMELLPFRGGPRLAAAQCCITRFDPNVRFPEHRHLGLELTAVLDGGLLEDGGDEFAAGSTMLKLPGSSHAFTCDPAGCLAAVALFEGLELDGRGTLRVPPKPSGA